MVIESNMSRYFNEEIFNDIEQRDYTMPAIEFQGYTIDYFETFLDPIFNREQVKKML